MKTTANTVADIFHNLEANHPKRMERTAKYESVLTQFVQYKFNKKRPSEASTAVELEFLTNYLAIESIDVYAKLFGYQPGWEDNEVVTMLNI